MKKTKNNKIKNYYKDVKAGKPIRWWIIKIKEGEIKTEREIWIPDGLLERVCELVKKPKFL